LWRQESAQGINPRRVRIGTILFGAVSLQDQELRGVRVIAEFGGKPAFADTGFTGKKNAAPRTTLYGSERPIKDF
jgi:hypothetical protein